METELKNYEVKLEIFEGPLDLLVYLVQKSELDPRDIPISIITDQYLDYLDKIGVDNLSSAGQFLVMASRLMWLKSQELLPADEKDEQNELEFALNRDELIQQMLEYQKFKEAAKYLKHLEMRNYGTFTRGIRDKLPQEKHYPEEQELEAEIYDLLMAFSNVVKGQKSGLIHEVEIDDVTIENQIEKIQSFLVRNPHFHFEELFNDDPRKVVIVVSFMAILELCKLYHIRMRQHQQYGPIWIYRRKGEEMRFPDMELSDMELGKLGPFKPGLVKYLQEEIKKKDQTNTLERLLGEMEFLKETEIEEPNPDARPQREVVGVKPLHARGKPSDEGDREAGDAHSPDQLINYS